MGLFSKKDDAPQIPPAPRLPELPESLRGTNELPSLPNNLSENLNREMVKSAVDDSGEENMDFEELPQSFRFEEPKEVIRPLPEIPAKTEFSRDYERKNVEISRVDRRTKEEEPVFVRIDKFQNAQEDFEEIKKKVKQIEDIIKRVNDERVKEDEEIALWRDNLEKIKDRLSDIDSNIFDRI